MTRILLIETLYKSRTIKGTVMQIEKPLINDRLRFSKAS